MVFMDYRIPLRAALETTYTDALGRPLLDIAEYNTFRQLSHRLLEIPLIYLYLPRFGTAMAFQPNGMFIETLNKGILEARMMGFFDFWLRKTLFHKKAIVTAAK